jgi:alpha-amylase
MPRSHATPPSLAGSATVTRSESVARSESAAGPAPHPASDAILHAFNWPFTLLAQRAQQIAELGYGAVLLPPPLYTDEHGPEWWQRYQPKDYRVVRSYLGNKRELAEALAALHAHGVLAYADVVFNHMANEKWVRPDPYHFPGANELRRYRDERAAFEADRLYGDLGEGLFSPWDFNPQGDISNWNDLEESQEHWLFGLPDLDLNAWVVAQQRSCLRALNELGFDGYRIDAIKHLPLEHLRGVFLTPEMEGKFVFGEALTANDAEEEIFLWPLVGSTALAFYDFPLHETLRRVFAPGGSLRELVDPAAFRQALPAGRSVTFTVTHDIPNNDGFRWQLLDRQDEFLANAYLLGRAQGLPLVYSDRNESAAQHRDDGFRWNEAWCRADTAAMVRFRAAVQGTPERCLYESDTVLVLARGERGIVALNKSGECQRVSISATGLASGTWKCALSDALLEIGGSANLGGSNTGSNAENSSESATLLLEIPPRQARLWLAL